MLLVRFTDPVMNIDSDVDRYGTRTTPPPSQARMAERNAAVFNVALSPLAPNEVTSQRGHAAGGCCALAAGSSAAIASMEVVGGLVTYRFQPSTRDKYQIVGGEILEAYL